MAQDDWVSAGETHGWSITTLEPLRANDSLDDPRLLVMVAADAAWFEDSAIAEAAASMRREVEERLPSTTAGARLYQFSAIPEPRVIIEVSLLVWQALGPNLIASAIWDGVKILLARRGVRAREGITRETSIEINTITPTGERVVSIVRTNDPEVARAAIARIPDPVEVLSSRAKEDRIILRWSNDEDGEGEWL